MQRRQWQVDVVVVHEHQRLIDQHDTLGAVSVPGGSVKATREVSLMDEV